jgi:predicted nucleic acid-binding protein
MPFVLDASIAAAWFLPDEQNDAADSLMTELRSGPALVPSLFWFEIRNIFLMAERRGLLQRGSAPLLMGQLRRLSMEDGGSGRDTAVLELAARHLLSAYDASYLDLAKAADLPLATGDRKLAVAARSEGVMIVGPLENER